MRRIALGSMGMSNDGDLQYFERINGSFVLTTDAEVGEHNGSFTGIPENKPESVIRWQIDKGEFREANGRAVRAQLILPCGNDGCK